MIQYVKIKTKIAKLKRIINKPMNYYNSYYLKLRKTNKNFIVLKVLPQVKIFQLKIKIIKVRMYMSQFLFLIYNKLNLIM